jgi:hypothetical protein
VYHLVCKAGVVDTNIEVWASVSGSAMGALFFLTDFFPWTSLTIGF